MPIISFIPPRYEEGFKKMSSVKTEMFEAIVEGLTYTSLVSSISILADKIADIKKLDIQEVKEILLSAGSLITFLDKEYAIDQVVDDVSNAAMIAKIIDPKNIDDLKGRLTFLLNSQPLYYAAKANALATEYGNVFIQAKIITDLRPVFSATLDDPPKACVIVHNLHIHYQADAEGDHKDFYLALDSKDVAFLKDALIRAEKKEKSLRLFYDKTGMINLKD